MTAAFKPSRHGLDLRSASIISAYSTRRLARMCAVAGMPLAILASSRISAPMSSKGMFIWPLPRIDAAGSAMGDDNDDIRFPLVRKNWT